MIGKLKGLINSYGEDYVLLDVGGVGYQVHCSARTLQALPSPGEAAVLSIETYVREDQIKLFGFRTDNEREWFRLLQTVQGVGAKVALAVLSTLPPSELANAITLRDKAAVARTHATTSRYTAPVLRTGSGWQYRTTRSNGTVATRLGTALSSSALVVTFFVTCHLGEDSGARTSLAKVH